jgi:hypothetical protein
MEDVGIIYGGLVHFTVFCYTYFMDICYSSWKFGIFFPFSRFGILSEEKSGNPGSAAHPIKSESFFGQFLFTSNFDGCLFSLHNNGFSRYLRCNYHTTKYVRSGKWQNITIKKRVPSKFNQTLYRVAHTKH